MAKAFGKPNDGGHSPSGGHETTDAADHSRSPDLLGHVDSGPKTPQNQRTSTNRGSNETINLAESMRRVNFERSRSREHPAQGAQPLGSQPPQGRQATAARVVSLPPGIPVSCHKALLTLRMLSIEWTKAKEHYNQMHRYIEATVIPRGMRIKNDPGMPMYDAEFKKKWQTETEKSSIKLMDMLKGAHGKAKEALEDKMLVKLAELKSKIPADILKEAVEWVNEAAGQERANLMRVVDSKFSRDCEEYHRNILMDTDFRRMSPGQLRPSRSPGRNRRPRSRGPAMQQQQQPPLQQSLQQPPPQRAGTGWRSSRSRQRSSQRVGFQRRQRGGWR